MHFARTLLFCKDLIVRTLLFIWLQNFYQGWFSFKTVVAYFNIFCYGLPCRPVNRLIFAQIQYSPFITLHTRGIFSVAPRNFSHGKTKNYAWHGELPRVEKGFTTPRNCHAWQLLMMRKHTILTVLKLLYTVLLTNSSVWPMHLTNCASYGLVLSSCKFQLLPSSASI